MTPYIKQKKGYNCGPVALYNALIMLGHNPSLIKLERLCKVDKDGTLEKDMKKATKSSLPIIASVGTASSKSDRLDIVRKIVMNDCSFILGYMIGSEGHYNLVTKDHSVIAYNSCKDEDLSSPIENMKVKHKKSYEWLIRHCLNKSSEIYLIGIHK